MRRSTRLIVASALLLTSQLLSAQTNTGTIRTTVDLYLSNYTLTSPARAWFECYSFYCEIRALSGQHWVANDSFQTAASETFSVAPNTWQGTLQPNGQPGVCYRATLNANSQFGESQGAGSAQYCTPPPQCHLSSIATTGGTVSNTSGEFDCGSLITITAYANDGYHFVNWTGDVNQTSATIQFTLGRDMSVYANFAANPSQPPPDPTPGGPIGGCETDCGSSWNPDPLVLDLNGDGIHTTGVNDMMWFDLDGNGANDHITWTNGGTVEGFLWINLMGKNRVDNGSELLGIGTELADGTKAKDGFQALARYDALDQGGNGDGMIDAQDAVWNKLRVWIDANHNGVCEPSEVFPLHKFAVEGISLSAVRAAYTDENGNVHGLRGHYWRRVGDKVQMFDLDSVSFRGEHH